MYVFSIITPTFKRINNLESQYNNLLNQRSTEFLIEWVVIVEPEDFITINFLKKINKIKVVIVINKNKNFSNLLRQGIKNSSGKYVCFLGDDDGFYKKKLKKVYDLIIDNNYPTWIIGDGNYVDEKNKITRKFISLIKSFFLKYESKYLIQLVNFYMTPSVIIKKKQLLKINYFNSDYGNVNDYYTWIELRKLVKPIITLDKLSFAYYDLGSISYSYNFEKYENLHKILKNNNKILYLPGISILFFIFIYNFFLKIILFLIDIFFKRKEKKNLVKKKKILHLTRFFYDQRYGGIQEVIRQISRNSKHTHVVASTSENDKPLIKLEKNLYSISFKKNFSLLGDVFSLGKFKYIINNHEDFQIFHVHFPYFFSLFYIFLLRFYKKTIITYHANVTGFRKVFAFLFFFFFSRYIKNISFFHLSTKKYLLNTPIKNFKNVIIQPFTIRKIVKLNKKSKYKNIFKGEKYFIFIGKNRYYKNIELLLNIVKNYKEINLLILTDKKVDLSLKNLRVLLNINDNEKFSLLKNSNGLVFPSNHISESYGMVLLEAMMMGVPSIIFDIGAGSSVLVKNNYNGIVVKNFDKEKYINSLLKIKNNKKLFKRLSSNCKIFYNNRFKKSGYTKLENIYSKI